MYSLESLVDMMSFCSFMSEYPDSSNASTVCCSHRYHHHHETNPSYDLKWNQSLKLLQEKDITVKPVMAFTSGGMN